MFAVVSGHFADEADLVKQSMCVNGPDRTPILGGRLAGRSAPVTETRPVPHSRP